MFLEDDKEKEKVFIPNKIINRFSLFEKKTMNDFEKIEENSSSNKYFIKMISFFGRILDYLRKKNILKPETIQIYSFVSLSELEKNNFVKKVNFVKKTVLQSIFFLETITIQIQIPPDIKNGTKLIFNEKGHQINNKIGDLCVIVMILN
jgi:hypothetical protein